MEDFYGFSGTKYYDKAFPINDALYWADMPTEKNGFMKDLEGRVTWMRGYDVFADYPFWGDDGITPLDVRQGAIGNCWFMAAASALAEKPKRLEKVFLDKSGKMRSDGLYGFNIFTLGVPHTVLVDDYLPL